MNLNTSMLFSPPLHTQVKLIVFIDLEEIEKMEINLNKEFFMLNYFYRRSYDQKY